jgi:hypothetical protein
VEFRGEPSSGEWTPEAVASEVLRHTDRSTTQRGCGRRARRPARRAFCMLDDSGGQRTWRPLSPGPLPPGAFPPRVLPIAAVSLSRSLLAAGLLAFRPAGHLMRHLTFGAVRGTQARALDLAPTGVAAQGRASLQRGIFAVAFGGRWAWGRASGGLGFVGVAASRGRDRCNRFLFFAALHS